MNPCDIPYNHKLRIMKILIIDYMSVPAHQNFNKIHIDVLLSQGHSLTLVGRKGQFDNIGAKQNVPRLVIPEFFYYRHPFPQLSTRIQGNLCLLWIRGIIKFKIFDCVVIPTYDILSFFLFRVPNKVVIIDHNNVSQLENKVKRLLTILLPKRFIHVALNSLMEARLRELFPDKTIYHIPHGVLFKPVESNLPHFLNSEKAFFFCPVNSNYNKDFVQAAFNSAELQDYLEQLGMQMYIKTSLNIHPSSANISSVSTLSNAEYDYMISHASAVILPYSNLFKYRCSGVLFECVSYDTPVLATKLEDMLIYQDIINIKFFDNPQSMVTGLNELLFSPPMKNDVAKLNPATYWEKMIAIEFPLEVKK